MQDVFICFGFYQVFVVFLQKGLLQLCISCFRVFWRIGCFIQRVLSFCSGFFQNVRFQYEVQFDGFYFWVEKIEFLNVIILVEVGLGFGIWVLSQWVFQGFFFGLLVFKEGSWLRGEWDRVRLCLKWGCLVFSRFLVIIFEFYSLFWVGNIFFLKVVFQVLS